MMHLCKHVTGNGALTLEGDRELITKVGHCYGLCALVRVRHLIGGFEP